MQTLRKGEESQSMKENKNCITGNIFIQFKVLCFYVFKFYARYHEIAGNENHYFLKTRYYELNKNTTKLIA